MATSSGIIFNCLLVFIWFITAYLVLSLIQTFSKPYKNVLKTPPSPPALPIIGHLYLFIGSSVQAKTFQRLARQYGPLMQLRLGASTCVVVSSAAVAKEILKTHELNFSSRPEFGYSEYSLYKGSGFFMAPYGDYWRFIKKLTMNRLLAVPQLAKFIDVRERELVKLVESVRKNAIDGKPVDLSEELPRFTNNIICSMAMSTRCSGSDDEAEFIKVFVKDMVTLAGKLAVGDVLGPLKMFDFSRIAEKLLSTMQMYDQLVERVIKEHELKALSNKVYEDERKDLLDILLEIYRDPAAEFNLTRKDIKSFLLEIFVGGTDTSSVAMQWAMRELINNPQAFNKLRNEIHSVVGHKRLVKESDVPNLPYLRAVIKEILRLHPSAPLIPRECAEDCKVNGYLIKAKTRIFVNVYAVMRDPKSWKDPDGFIPERFLDSSNERIGEHLMELKGQNFHYLPFGSGRRACPGASLAMTVMHVTIGALVQCFDWRVKGSEKVDLREGSGLVAGMATPLVCYPTMSFNSL